MNDETLYLINMMRNLFDTITNNTDELLLFKINVLYRKLLVQYYGPGGSHINQVLLYEHEIDKIVLNTSIDVSMFIASDIESEEFYQMMESFVSCIGKFFIDFYKISPSFSKEELIIAITKQLTLDFTL